jgi:hypothetical protein
MRDEELDLIEAGDLLDYLPPGEQRPNRFQVFKIEHGKIFAVRVLGQGKNGATELTTTETAVITGSSPNWSLVRLKTKVMATGGFIVKRAATGETEYDKCPSALDRSLKAAQTLESRR